MVTSTEVLEPATEQTQVTPKFQHLSTRLHSVTSPRTSPFQVNEIKDTFTHLHTALMFLTFKKG